MEKPNNSLYRMLPQVGDLLDRGEAARLAAAYSGVLVADETRAGLARLRREIRDGSHTEESLEGCVERVFFAEVEERLQERMRPSLRRVINATGVILQTNLGRAPLCAAAVESIVEVASGYCNVEMDVETGERSRRDVHVESLLLDVLAVRTGGAEVGAQPQRAAAVVNNCAAATLLALDTLADGGEVIVSRGELVEIGGGFRVPDILRKSGAILREVGTTNRTRVADYAAAITPQTRLILRVHRSNFRIEGFTEAPSREELIELGAKSSVPVFEDQGTGCVVSLEEYGISHESSWVESATSGVALVSASGDKLLGGPQCGILVGERAIVERLRANPLFRALRVDKLTYAALQATLLAYLAGQEETIPAIAMLRMSAEAIRARCEMYVESLRSEVLRVEVVATRSVLGGGTTPGASLPSFAVALQHKGMNEGALAERLRKLSTPVLGRVHEGKVLLDLRTIREKEDAALIELLQSSLGDGGELMMKGSSGAVR